jgi:hypothetical protein
MKRHVGERTLIKRINYALNSRNLKVRTRRYNSRDSVYGRYYVTAVETKDVYLQTSYPDFVFDLEGTGRKLGCLAEDETVGHTIWDSNQKRTVQIFTNS